MLDLFKDRVGDRAGGASQMSGAKRVMKELRSARTEDDRLMFLRASNRRNVEMKIHTDSNEGAYTDHVSGMVP